MTYLIIDTNVCLHFTPIDQYPWFDQLRGAENITIVITHPLIEELDKMKYRDKNHIKERAASTLKLIERMDGIPLRNGCVLFLYNEHINTDYVESEGLDSSNGDDRLIASILKFQKEDSGRKIIFVSNDLGPRLKAKKFKIETISPDPENQLKSPENEYEKTIRNLKLENEKLKGVAPKLSITFKDNKEISTNIILKYLGEREDFITAEISKIRQKHESVLLNVEKERERNLEIIKKRDSDKTISEKLLVLHLKAIRIITDEELERYKLELTSFYPQYEKYLIKLFDYKVKERLTLEVNFELNNIGTSPAEDIDISFHFPDGFDLFSEEDYPIKPNSPREPTLPLPNLDKTLKFPSLPISGLRVGDLTSPISHYSNLSIKKTNSYDVEIYVNKLKHNKTEGLDKMFVVFNSYESVINFTVDYEIKCSNVPQVITGKLNFLVEVKNEC